MFKTKTYYIRLYSNAAEVKEIETGRIIKKTSDIPFSNSRLLIAYFEQCEVFLRELIDEFKPNKSILKDKIDIVFQPMELIEDGLSPTEKRAFRDTAMFIGGRRVSFLSSTKLASDEEVLANFSNPDNF